MTAAILTNRSAAQEMGVSPSTIRSWVRYGWLPVTARGPRRKAYYRRDDVLKAERRARRGAAVAPADDLV
jgi:DNA-binding transcriptional MerR regulator